MGLDLYAKIEEYLDFDEAVVILHKQFLSFIFEKDCNNILDIGCGQGYFLENLNINGKKSFGIDLSDEQILRCKQKGIKNCKCIDLKDVKDKYDCTTAIFDVVNYIPKNNLEIFFRNVHKVLNKNGYFLFDINSLFGFEDVAQGAINMDLEDKFIAIDANFEDDKLITDITLFTKNKNKSFTKENDFIIQYYYENSYLNEVLQKVGFKIEKIKDIFLHGFEQKDKYMFICKKV